MLLVKEDKANVVVFLPLLFAAPLVLGLLLHWWQPILLLPESLVMFVVGWGLVVAGVMLARWARREFRAAGGRASVYMPSHKIITTGPYGLGRNPMYLSLTVFYLGITVLVNSLWLLILLVPTLLVVHGGVIIPEEQYLEAKLGDEYRRYKEKVRRWI